LLRQNLVDRARKELGSLCLIGVLSLFDCGVGRGAVMSPPSPSPDDGNVIDFFVADQETYDSNLFRLPKTYGPISTPASPNSSRDDYFNSGTLGGDGQWLFGRQVVGLDVRADQNWFAKNQFLNDTSYDGKLLWNWVVGSRLSGDAGAEVNRSLASFAETLYLGKDLIDTTKYFADGRYQLNPRWAVLGDFRDTDYTHSAVAVQFNNFRAKAGDVGIEYATAVDDTFQLQYSYTDGYYPQDYLFEDVLVNRDFHEYTGRFLVKYGITDKTIVTGYAGYLKRNFVESQLGSYSGDIWRVSVDWHPTDKTDLVASAWHELHAYTASEADYFVSHGFSLGPVWTASEKLTLSMVFSVEDQDYIASSTSVLLIGSRTDKITGEQLNLLYTPRSDLFVNLFFRHEQRSSTDEATFQYDDDLARLSVTFKFW
jgi:hypothetical protein